MLIRPNSVIPQLVYKRAFCRSSSEFLHPIAVRISDTYPNFHTSKQFMYDLAGNLE